MIDEERDYLLGTAREIYGRICYSHKTHEKEREIWGATTTRMNLVNVFLAGATTFLAIISATLTIKTALVATAISAAATVVFVVWQGSFDPAGKENQQRTAAKELLWIREQLLLLIMDCHMPSVPLIQLQKCLEMINREVTAVYKFAPSTSPKALNMAREEIKKGDATFSDSEIDDLLPSVLRKQKQIAPPSA
jgi:hypothetical protein